MSPAIISILILVFCIVLFVWEPVPTGVSALLGSFLLVLLGVADWNTIFSNYVSNTIILFASMLVIGEALMVTGAGEIIGKFILKVSRGNDRIFMVVILLTSFVMSCFLANTVVIASLMAIVAGVCKQSKTITMRDVMMPVAVMAIIGGISTIVGSTQQLAANQILVTQVGYGFEFAEFLRITGPVGITALLYFVLIGPKLGHKIWGARDEAEAEEAQKRAAEIEANAVKREIDPVKVRIVFGIFIVVIALFLWGGISSGLVALMGALACLLTKCVTFKQAQSMPSINIVFWLAGCLALSSGLSASGASTLIGDLFVSLFGADVSPMLFFVILCFITMILSTFASSTMILVLMLTAVIPICETLGLNLYCVAIGITMSASLVWITPLANGHVGMVAVAGYKFTDYFFFLWPLAILAFIEIVVLVPIWYPLMA